MIIHIEALTFQSIIGILDFERKKPQTVVVDIKIDYTYKQNIFINYADIIALIEKELQVEKYELLEEALLGLQTLLLGQYPLIQKLNLKISKPNIINNANVALSLNWISKNFHNLSTKT